MATTVEQIVNQALMLARRTRRIADIQEGSAEAKVALELYGQCRDSLLDLKDWSFSRQRAYLTLLKGPPPAGGYYPNVNWSSQYPAPGWLFEYDYPSDCLDLRAILEPPGPMPDLDPVPQLFVVDNDLTPILTGTPPNATASGPPRKVIYANAANAIAVYRARVTNPAQFDTGFTESLVAKLAEQFTVAFGENISVEQAEAAKAMGTANIESSLRG